MERPGAGQAQAAAEGLRVAPPPDAVPPSTAHYAQRTVLKDAAFFLDHVRAGMRLLDCGCGPGATSAGPAEVVAPGELVGIDTNDRHLALARAHAADRGLRTARFEHADIHALPFPAGSFDGAFVRPV